MKNYRMFGEEEAEVQEDDFDVDDAIRRQKQNLVIYTIGPSVVCGDKTKAS